MKNRSSLMLKITILLLLFSHSMLQAALLISPTKIKLEDRERATQLILINTSDAPITYRLSWEEKTVSDKGKYQQLTEQQLTTFPSASNMIRFSPKQVKLKPGSRQVIKIAVRRPKDLQMGEYRSHLKLSAVPDEREKPQNNEMSIKATMLFSYVLPVIVRKGVATSAVTITDISLKNKTEKTPVQLIVQMKNKSKYSTTGNLIAYLADSNGNEEVIARLHDFTFYPDKNRTQAQLVWLDNCKNKCSGRLRVAFEGIKENIGKIFAEQQIDINADSFK
ncbi:hypothetical protein CW745_11080 [Psychromonas sp. psych-6C06]|uniref:fimbrial biogenesis chaperone n=1 Tax=Psychromonas sp. psych-6C06 TaxID=2058089 RepID=UPI000C33A5FB|nr:molecular chaperone [Psychromonas sp. psych-6C06]PKF61170.1 hypothetical protein CW745_11080 [Psychromonas sp. psych-6C06]